VARTRLRLYSILRHYAGTSEVEVEAPPGATVRDIVEAAARANPGIAEALKALSGEVLVLDEHGRRLDPGARVEGGLLYLMPPPEGGRPRWEAGVRVKGDPPGLDAILERALAAGGNTGAIVYFVGVVRRENRGRRVSTLVYEHADNLTLEKLKQVVAETVEKHRLYYAAAYHYVGELEPGDTTMVVVVAARDRSTAYPALHELVERVKHEVPIWKLEVYEDGTRAFLVGGKAIEDRRGEPSRSHSSREA